MRSLQLFFTMILITIYCTPAEATHSAHIQSSGV